MSDVRFELYNADGSGVHEEILLYMMHGSLPACLMH
jgi:hypothetical protein